MSVREEKTNTAAGSRSPENDGASDAAMISCRIEEPVETLYYSGVGFELVRRADVIWTGCVDYAANNTDESDIGATLERFQRLVECVPMREKINPDWSAAISINYNCPDRPNGLMFANETFTTDQDERYETFTQPGGLWLRVRGDGVNAAALLGRERAELYEFFAPLQDAAKANGYIQSPDIHAEIEYHCHAEYSNPPHTCYAYIAVVRAPDGAATE